MKHTLYVAAYTSYPPADGKSADGLFVYQMDGESGRLERIRAVDAGENPSFIALSAGRDRVYLCNESSDGDISAFAIEPGSRELRFLNRQKVMGADPCYASLDPSDRWLLAACYSSGSVSVFSVEEDGRLGAMVDRVQHEGSGPNHLRQEKAHAHCIRFDPGNRSVFVVDLGLDRVFTYHQDPQTGKLSPQQPGGFSVHAGAGPRHLAYHPTGRFVYVSNELDSTVSTCSWDIKAGAGQELQSLATIGDGFLGDNSVADIHITPGGEFLYVSNRGENSLGAFRVDAQSGMLTPIGSFSCGGDWPRNFAIDPTGRFLIAANQKSANLVVFRVGEDGSLNPADQEAVIVAPVCVVFA